MNAQEQINAVEYVWSFYGSPSGLYADTFAAYPITVDEVHSAMRLLASKQPIREFASFERELVRDILLARRGVQPEALEYSEVWVWLNSN